MNEAPVKRVWAMPNAETFSISPIRDLVMAHLAVSNLSIDPFARNTALADITNDLNPTTCALYHMDCLDFALFLRDQNLAPDLVLFDPPYSHRQAVEVYAGVGKEWTKADQQQIGRWTPTKDILAEIMAPGGFAISFGWSTTGFGKHRGFQPVRYMLVNHGSAHNDTLVTVEVRK